MYIFHIDKSLCREFVVRFIKPNNPYDMMFKRI